LCHPVLGGFKYVDLALQVEGVANETVTYFISPFLFAICTNASTFSKWCDGRRGREKGAHQHPTVIRGAKPSVEVGIGIHISLQTKTHS
jgi:hypothetical protein